MKLKHCLIHEVKEVNRQFAFQPKALHPQMESIMALVTELSEKEAPDSKLIVMSVASAGFHQLADMSEVPDSVADDYQVSKKGFSACCVINLSSKLMEGTNETLESGTLDKETAHHVQVYLGLYASQVYDLHCPLIVNLSPVPAAITDYEGTLWFTYAFRYIAGVDPDEWEKLFLLKRDELLWANQIRNKEQAEAQELASSFLQKFQL